MPAIRVVLLWHMHQPYYKDLVTGEYRLPWVRLHALKDYYGMVRVAEEFPGVHQTFNLVPSLVAQIQEYAAGTARDPFLELASKPAAELSPDERRQALQYLFQANPVHVIGRYPRYRDLWERYHGAGEIPSRAERFFQDRDYTDLQVLSQLAWFDEYFLQEPEIAALVRKGHDYTREEQVFVMAQESKLLQRVLPEYVAAAHSGVVELSTSPFYHPILPLLCDTDVGGVSSPGRPLPLARFQHPEDAQEQLRRGLELHERVFGSRPRGVWPSEGSVSEPALALAQEQGVQWMATDEGVLGRSLDFNFARDGSGRLPQNGAEKLYTIYRFEKENTRMHLFFRDHTLSDLIGFVYSGMPAREAAEHLMRNIKESAKPVLAQGKDAVVSIILDGENAWEYYPQSGREFLRRFYAALQKDEEVEAVTASEAIARQEEFGQVESLVPGSWINANFNIWIGAPEDNRSWDYLTAAHNFFTAHAAGVDGAKRELAYQELLIAEGSDWNWWYGPEHHSVNDRDFDELYRKHLANVYQALGAAPPEHLAHPIYAGVARPVYVPQTAYIHPRVEGDLVRYFGWIGAAMYTADRRSGSMHGKQFVLDAVYAGIDEQFLYGRMDFVDAPPKERCDLLVNLELWAEESKKPSRALSLEAACEDGTISAWHLRETERGEVVAGSEQEGGGATLVLRKNFEFKLPLRWLAPQWAVQVRDKAATPAGKLRVRFSLWRDRLPIDGLPLEGWIELHLLSEPELAAFAFAQ
jgi:alpha-amylase/alpha-mannosidase (GH57 family)